MFNFDLKKIKIKLDHFKTKLDHIHSKFRFYRSRFNFYRTKVDVFLTLFVIHLARYFRKSQFFVICMILFMDWFIFKYYYFKKVYPYYYTLTPPKYRNGQCWVDDIPPLDEVYCRFSLRLPFKFDYVPTEYKIKVPKDVDILINQNVKIQIQDIEPYDYLLIFKNLPRFKYNSFETFTFQINHISDFNSFQLQSPIIFDELEISLILMYSVVTKEPTMLADVLHQRYINYYQFFYKIFFILKEFK